MKELLIKYLESHNYPYENIKRESVMELKNATHEIFIVTNAKGEKYYYKVRKDLKNNVSIDLIKKGGKRL